MANAVVLEGGLLQLPAMSQEDRRRMHSFGDEPPGPEFDRVLKLMITGDAGAGKTSFMNRFTDNIAPDHQYIATIGIDFKIKTVALKSERVKLQLWDGRGGTERFGTITRAYYRGAHGIFIMFDVTNRRQFENLEMWLERHATLPATPVQAKVIVGCKNDLRSSSRGAPAPSMVSYAEGQEFARSHGLTYVECSAKEGQSVEQVVHTLASSAQGFAIEKAARTKEESSAAQVSDNDRAPSHCTVQ